MKTNAKNELGTSLAVLGRWKVRVSGTQKRGAEVKYPRKMFSRRKAWQEIAERTFLVCYCLQNFEEDACHSDFSCLIISEIVNLCYAQHVGHCI